MEIYSSTTTSSNGNKLVLSFNSADDEGTIEIDDSQQVNNPIAFGTLSEEMLYYGLPQSFVDGVLQKIENANLVDSIAEPVQVSNGSGGFFTSSKGSLVSNSAQSLKNTTEYQKARLQLEQVKIKSLNVHNELLKKQIDLQEVALLENAKLNVQLTKLNSNMTLQTKEIKDQQIGITNMTVSPEVNIDVTPLIESNTIIASGVQNQINTNTQLLLDNQAKINAINSLTTATENQEISLNGDISLDADFSGLTQSNTILASGVEKQIETNNKIIENLNDKKEHYEFIKNGSENLKDSKGQIIKPREVQAKKQAEDSILTKDKNTFDTQDLIVGPLNNVLEKEALKDSETSSGFGDIELSSILGNILNYDLSKFDKEYSSLLFEKKES